ncbi:MAG: hypothetical protein LAP21_17345, partial [Acidobacteriia bacterium]|nr:hypothetical protein [Terriglobia bacterium]
GGTDQVELPGTIGTFDDLDFREIAHDGILHIAISLVKNFLIFSHVLSIQPCGVLGGPCGATAKDAKGAKENQQSFRAEC